MKSIKYVTAREEADRINQEIDDKSIHVRTYIDNYDIIHAEVYFSPNGGMSPHEAVQKAAKIRLAALRAASFKYNGYRIGY